VKHILKEIYGVGIMFFYFIKWFVFIGLPILYYGLDYKQNIIMNVLWFYCLILIIKDLVMRFIFKNRYCDIESK